MSDNEALTTLPQNVGVRHESEWNVKIQLKEVPGSGVCIFFLQLLGL